MTGKPITVAILDDYQNLSAGAFSTLPTSKFAITTFNDTLPPFAHPSTSSSDKAALIKRLKPFEVLCTMRERTTFPAALVKELPNLKVLFTTGTRNAALDLPALKEAGVKVCGGVGKTRKNASEPKVVGPDSTTQHCVAMILGLVRNLAADDVAVKTGLWQENVNTGLGGKTLGCLGFGRLGVSVAKIMYMAFGMKIVCWSSSLTQETCDEKAAEAGLPKGAFKSVGKEELMSTSDVVSVHYVLSDRSRGIVGKVDLAVMKKSAFLINTSRGPLVDAEALLQTLKEGKIRGAAIDVFEIEPLPKESAWRSTEWGKNGTSHLLLTPHMGYVQEDTMLTWYEEMAENLERYGNEEELLNSMI